MTFDASEHFARQIREVLGEDDDSNQPVVTLVRDLVRRNNDQAKMLGAFQGKRDEYVAEGFRRGMERAAELCKQQHDYCAERARGFGLDDNSKRVWLIDAKQSLGLCEVICAELEKSKQAKTGLY